jgi:AcrR family transcriptional regulator
MVKVSREQSERLRRRVLDATVAELALTGPASLAVTAVAKRAGVATSVVAHRFSTKERLIDAAVHERLEPVVGPSCDEVSAWLWGPPRPLPPRHRSIAEHQTWRAWHQVLTAAAFPSGPRSSALSVLERCVERSLALRDAAPVSTLRTEPDPTAQVLLPLSVDLGAWLVARGLDRPSRHASTARRLLRSAVRIESASPVTPTSVGHIPPNPRPPTRQPHDRIGRALLDATATAVAGDGFAATTVTDIAHRAGSSTGAVYNRFVGKGGLLAECLLDAHTAGDHRHTAVLIESLRVAPDDPEVAAAVRAVMRYAIAEEARSLALTDRNRGSGALLSPTAGAHLRVMCTTGHWVLGRILGVPERAWEAGGALLIERLAGAAGPRPQR